jgi:cytochrome c biogenesis protein CcmG/thiol:disulfide interchange protein DsbE
LIVFCSVLVLGSAWLWWSRPQAVATAATPAAGPGVDLLAPEITLPTLDGGQFVLSEQRGKPVVLNFWATWCQPCQRELPALQQAAAHFGDRVVFAGVDQGETAEVVQSYVDKLGLTFTIPMDGSGDVGYQYNVKGLPTTFFIDADGVIRSFWMGEMNSVTLAENIAKIEP